MKRRYFRRATYRSYALCRDIPRRNEQRDDNATGADIFKNGFRRKRRRSRRRHKRFHKKVDEKHCPRDLVKHGILYRFLSARYDEFIYDEKLRGVQKKIQ